MYKPVQTCTQCGANLTLDDMRGNECPYCKTVYPHKSMAAQHQQVINQQMGNLIAQQNAVQNQWRGAFGVGPQPPPGGMPGGPPPGMPGAPGYGPPGGYDHNAMMQHHMQQAHQTSRGIQKVVMVSLIGTFALIALISIMVFVLI